MATYWLIEQTEITPQGPLWLVQVQPLQWTHDASLAKHFPSKGVAEFAATHIPALWDVVITEHEDVPPPGEL